MDVIISLIDEFTYLMADSIREMRKYAYSDKTVTSMHNQPAAMDNLHMKQFRAQRNFYISGFALFLWM